MRRAFEEWQMALCFLSPFLFLLFRKSFSAEDTNEKVRAHSESRFELCRQYYSIFGRYVFFPCLCGERL